MSGIERVLVGYRLSNRQQLADLEQIHGLRAFAYKGCINCGETVCFVQSGVDAIRGRDPHPICDVCWAEPDVKHAIYSEL